MDKVLVKVLHRLREKDHKPGGQQQVNSERKLSDPTSSKSMKKDCVEEDRSQIISPEHSNVSEDFFVSEEAEELWKRESPDDEVASDEKKMGETAALNVGETTVSSSNQYTGELDEELTNFLRDFSAHEDAGPLELCNEGSLQDWIQRSKLNHNTHVEYSKAGLPIALKLTECLVEAEKDELKGERNPIPLASISSTNVLVRSDAGGLKGDYLGNPNEPKEVIDFVSIMSCVGDDPSAGETMSRLAALGFILFELFAGEEPMAEGLACSNVLSLNSISLKSEDSGKYPPKKKSQSFQDQNICSKCIARLKYLGTPVSIYSLVGNLLDLTHGDSCSDEAYSSLLDVLSDLKLMLDEPSRFLDNIVVNPMPILTIPSKFYGREGEVQLLEKLYKQHMKGCCNGVVISGKAGVGKSKLGYHTEDLASKSNSYFLCAKFDQRHTVSLAALSSIFDTLCNLFAQNSTKDQRKVLGESLQRALGIQAALLVGLLPNLSRLLPSIVQIDHSNCFDPSMSMRFLFDQLLRELSTYSRLAIFLDDLHWADPMSLHLIGSLIQSQNKSVFFTCVYRDDSANQNEAFNQWLRSEPIVPLKKIYLDNMTEHGVNQLISDSLHLSPRITRPLSSVLHHKAGAGNALFLRQLIESLKENGYIYVDLKYPKWSWDLDKISDLKISDNVVSLLIDSMQKLNDDLQFGLKVASCIGSSVKCSVLDILSKDLGQNLEEVLQLVSKKGFMNNVGGSMFCFCHAKIHQAAYELMTDHERLENHMRFGLGICSHLFNSNNDNGDLFFLSVEQINLAGPDSTVKHIQRATVAALNLKAGRRSMDLSDLYTSFKLFKHGISFLHHDHWNTDYKLSLDLHEAVSNLAAFMNNVEAVTFYTQQVFAHARCSDDKLDCMYAATKALSHASNADSIQSVRGILNELGEKPTRALGDKSLNADMINMNNTLQSMNDEAIIGISETNQKKIITLMKLYTLLGRIVHFSNPALMGAVSLRMVELTLNFGLTSHAPLAFAYYGQTLAMLGNFQLAMRIGRLALRLADKKDLQMFKFKPAVILSVYQSILWISTPFQSIIEAHMTGHQAGQQSGEIISARLNLALALSTKYVTGHRLSDLREACCKMTKKMMSQNVVFYLDNCALFYIQQCALIDGLHVLDLERFKNGLPGINNILVDAKKEGKISLLLAIRVHWLARTFLFRKFNDPSAKVKMSDMLSEKKIPLILLTVFGIFFEGLVSFQLARQASGQEAFTWMAKGEHVLKNMQHWNEHCSWNFENKLLLLMAEKMAILGRSEEAESLYEKSIRSANEHKFPHEEAIASEAAGMFYYDRGFHQKALDFLLHSAEGYKKWGALAVANRVETFIADKFGSDKLGPMENTLEWLSESREYSTKKRQGRID